MNGIIIFITIFIFLTIIICWRRSTFHYHDLLEASDNRCRELSVFLDSFSEMLNSHDDAQGAVNLMVRFVSDRLGAESVCFYEYVEGVFVPIGVSGNYLLLRSPSNEPYATPAALLEALDQERFPLHDGALGDLASRGTITLITEAEASPIFNIFPRQPQLGSVIVLPLLHEGRIIGLMVADSPQLLLKRFDADQIVVLQQMTPQLVLSMLFYKSYSALRSKLRLDQELEVARRIQSELLPASHPGWGKFKVSAFTRSAKEVNGDFYDFVEIDDNRLLIVIGDACGKGVPACMLTAMTRSFISSASWRFDNLASFLREVNNNLFADTEADRFVSLGCCLLDKRNGLLEFGRAGHTELITFVNNHIRRFNPDGSALGLMPGELAEYDTICLKCSPNSSYLLYSDGINEALNKNGEEFGTARLVKEFDASRKAGHSSEETLEHILHKVESFAAEQIDDQTLILVTFEGGQCQ